MMERAVDHRLHLFYDFTYKGDTAGDRLTELRLAQIAPPGFLHSTRLTSEAPRAVGDKSAWEWAEFVVSKDLHPFVRSLLDSRLGRDSDSPQSFCIRLSSHGLNLLAGRYVSPVEHGPAQRRVGGLALTYSDGAGGTVTMPLAIDGVTVHLFQTCVGVAVVTLRARDATSGLDPDLLVETLPRLCDERRTPSIGWSDQRAASDEARFTIGTVVRSLVEPGGCHFAERERVYSFCSLRFDGHIDERDRRDLAFRLSRHYSARYRPTPQYDSTFFVEPFDTVLHAASREGACTVVHGSVDDAGRSPEFIGTWMAQAHQRVYLPLQIATLHEHVELLWLAQGAGRHIDPERTDERQVAELENLCNRFLLFRLRYRLAQVSAITMHDLVYRATSEALGLALLVEKIGRDLVAVEQRLTVMMEKIQAHHRRVFERRFRIVTSIGSAGLAYLTADTVISRALEVAHGWHVATWWQDAQSWRLIAVAIGVVTYAYAWHHERSGGHDSAEMREHAVAEPVLESGESVSRRAEGSS